MAVEEDVLKADDVWMDQPLQARRLGQRRVRLVDAVAADHLEHIRPLLTHHEVCTTIAASP